METFETTASTGFVAAIWRRVASRAHAWSPLGVPRVHAWTLLALSTFVACGLGLAVGHGDLTDDRMRNVWLELRAYRVATAFLCGAALSVAGVLVQGVFHNALACPSVLGVTSGAALGGKLALLGYSLLSLGSGGLPLSPDMVVPLGCMAGAVVAFALLAAVARRITGKLALLLTGFLLSSLFLSLGSFVVTLGQGRWELGRALVSFTMGGVSAAGPRHALLVLPLSVIGVAAAGCFARSLDMLLSGETEAQSFGVDTKQVKRWGIAWAALLSAGAVSVGGNVGFVGLIVPHALRSLFGVTHRPLIVGSALAGGAFVVSCDVLTRLAPAGAELPLGVVTGLIGAPLFFLLLARDAHHE